MESRAAIESLLCAVCVRYARSLDGVCMKNDTDVHHLREMIYRHNLVRRLDFISLFQVKIVYLCVRNRY